MQQGEGATTQLAEAIDFAQPPRPASPAHSAASAPNNRRDSEIIRPSINGTNGDSLHAVPGPELTRRYTTIIPAGGRRQDGQGICRTFPTTPVGTQRAFFISPLLKTPKLSRDVSPERNIEATSSRLQMTQPEKKHTHDTEKSNGTEEEWDHHVRMERKRRIREFPRRIATSIVGGIFVIVPMVCLRLTWNSMVITEIVAGYYEC